MMFCKHCGAEKKESDKFCRKCGTPSIILNDRPAESNSPLDETTICNEKEKEHIPSNHSTKEKAHRNRYLIYALIAFVVFFLIRYIRNDNNQTSVEERKVESSYSTVSDNETSNSTSNERDAELDGYVGTWMLYEGFNIPRMRVVINKDYSATIETFNPSGGIVLEVSSYKCYIYNDCMFFPSTETDAVPKLKAEHGNLYSFDEGINLIRTQRP